MNRLIWPYCFIIAFNLNGCTIGNPINEKIAGENAIYGMMSVNAFYQNKNTGFPLHLLGWQSVDLNDNPTDTPAIIDEKNGLAFDIWKHIKEDKVIFAFRGSDSLLDWKNNLTFIKSSDFNRALKEVDNYKYKHPEKKIMVTGHSLGGGLSLGVSIRRDEIDAIMFDPSPNDKDPLSIHNSKSNRLIIYEDNEILQYVRNFVELIGKKQTVPEENIYYTKFNFANDPISRHQSYALALGLVKMGLTANPELSKIIEALKLGEEASSKLNWMNQTALASLYATHLKNNENKITDNFSNVSCINQENKSSFSSDWIKSLGEIESGQIPLDDKQRKEAWDLFVSGRANEDIRKSIEHTLVNLNRLNPQFFQKNILNFVSPFNKINIINALKEDFQRFDQNKPSILTHTLKEINAQPLGVIVSDTVKIFIHPKNRTMRLAIIAYARMNGINIKEENLNDLYNLFGDNPDFFPLVTGAILTMREEYGFDKFQDATVALNKNISVINKNEDSCK